MFAVFRAFQPGCKEKSMAKLPHFIHNTDIGQNFLIDRTVVDFMIARATLSAEDFVLEIGPGEGMLTEGLLSTELGGLCTLELDTRLKHVIETIARRDDRMHALWGDAVQFDYENALPWFPNRVIANLPYHITTPLLWAFFEKLVPHSLKYMLLMVQLESAQRISAAEGSRDRSPLGITMEALGMSEIVRKIPPSAFRPQPRVNSCLIEIKIENNADLARDKTWRSLLSRSFAQRRKTLINNWTAGYPQITREIAQGILEKYGLKPTARAEELPLEVWFALAKDPVFLIVGKNTAEEGTA